MRPSKTITAIIALAALPGLAACDSFDAGYDKAWKEEMVKACIPEAVKAGAPQEFAETQCNCVADKLLAEMDGITETSNPSMDNIEKAATDCVAQSGLPAPA